MTVRTCIVDCLRHRESSDGITIATHLGRACTTLANPWPHYCQLVGGDLRLRRQWPAPKFELLAPQLDDLLVEAGGNENAHYDSYRAHRCRRRSW